MNRERHQAEYELFLRYLNVMEQFLVENFTKIALQNNAEIFARLNKHAERNPKLSIEDFLVKYYSDVPEVQLATSIVFDGCNRYIKDNKIEDVLPYNIKTPESCRQLQTVSECVAMAAQKKYDA